MKKSTTFIMAADTIMDMEPSACVMMAEGSSLDIFRVLWEATNPITEIVQSQEG